MIREPNGTTDMFTPNKQPWRPIVNGRTSMEAGFEPTSPGD